MNIRQKAITIVSLFIYSVCDEYVKKITDIKDEKKNYRKFINK